LAYADDLLATLRNSRQVPAFRKIINIYERGSGAMLSWPKTYGLRIGSCRQINPLPEAWSPTEMAFRQVTVIRELGIYLGSDQQITNMWTQRVTNCFEERFNLWGKRLLPNTLIGRNPVCKNSVLSLAWYLTEHQTPPDLDALLQSWQDLAWRFFDDSLRSVATGSRGSTLIRRSLLVQDRLEGGTRAADVQTFARSLYITQAVSLLDPPLHDFKRIALHWIQQHYMAIFASGCASSPHHAISSRCNTAPPDSGNLPCHA
jgi:hypothetical protein